MWFYLPVFLSVQIEQLSKACSASMLNLNGKSGATSTKGLPFRRAVDASPGPNFRSLTLYANFLILLADFSHYLFFPKFNPNLRAARRRTPQAEFQTATPYANFPVLLCLLMRHRIFPES